MIPHPALRRFDLPHGLVTVDLRRLFPHASFVGGTGIFAAHATDRSDLCQTNSVFAIIRGSRQNGAGYIADALSRGATALLTDRPQPGVHVPQCIVPDVRRAYAELCAALAAHPSRHLALAGVTGTNGKTTTTWLIRALLRAAGHQAGLLGTIEYHDGVNSLPARLTTPDPATLNEWLGAMVEQRTTCAALEVSSHALDQKRLAGNLLDAAVLTNITHDHLDYHGSFEHYRAAKQKIFNLLKPTGWAIVNLDDAGSHSCLPAAPRQCLTYSLGEPADFRGELLDITPAGTHFRVSAPGWTRDFRTTLVGHYNISNCLAAIAVAHTLQLDLDAVQRGLAHFRGVPGRCERIEAGQPFPVYVDYAHTPDGLRNCLAALRPLVPGRLICVFGAGGDRDQAKRPLMGRAVADGADLPVLTSDNPRSEDPQEIIGQIAAGMTGSHRRPFIEPDRRQAIRWALQHAGPNDLVLIAGKGHETEQIIGTERRHFDDREVALECLRERHAVFPGPHTAPVGSFLSRP
jgi:UDP-N-acetylmuramoyl-L-alanyl-D-glutamate--2,6-diaminopimelate ligase